MLTDFAIAVYYSHFDCSMHVTDRGLHVLIVDVCRALGV